MKTFFQFLAGQCATPFAKRRNATMQGLTPFGMFFFLLVLLAQAAVAGNWDGDNAVGNFSYNNNWYSDAQPTWNSSTTLEFNYRNNSSQTTLYYDYSSWKDANQMLYQSTFGAGVTLSGNGNGINLYGKVENLSSHAQTISIPLSFKNGTTAEVDPTSANLTLTGPMYNDNTKNLNVYGNNGKTLTLSGSASWPGNNPAVKLIINQNSIVNIAAAQNYTGNTEINAGELWLSSGGSLAAGNNIYVGNGGALSTTAKLWLNGSGLSLSKNISVNNGNASTRFIGGLNTSGTATYSGTIALSGPVNLVADQSGGTVAFSGVISHVANTSSVNINGGASSAGTVTLSGNNTFTGGLTLSGGTLTAQTSAGALGAGTLVLNTAGTTLNFYDSADRSFGRNTTVSADMTIKSDRTTSGAGRLYTLGTLGIGANILAVTMGSNVNDSNARLTFGATTLSGAPTFNVGSGAVLTLGAVGGSYALTKAGAGTLSLGSAGTYNGGTTIRAGNVIWGDATALGSGLVTLNDASTGASDTPYLYRNAAGTLANNITVANLGSGNPATIGKDSGNVSVTYSGTITLNKATRLRDDSASGTTTFNAQITGSGAISKTGGGKVVLSSGANNFTGGITIDAGTLALSGSGAIASSPVVSVAGGATFDVSGRTTALTLASGQGLTVTASGSASPATIATTTSKGLTTAANSPLVFSSYSSAGGAPLTVTGASSLTLAAGNPVTVTVSGGQLTVAGSPYKLVSIGSGNTVAVNGTAPTSVTVNGDGAEGGASLSIVGGELYLVIVPVPPTIVLADNGTVSAANVVAGTSAHVLLKFSAAVTVANATLNTVAFTTSGTYQTADITNLKLRYSTDATLDGADATLATTTGPAAAGAKTFSSFSQTINVGNTGYFFITADVASGATAGRTIGVAAMANADLTFASGNKSGSASAGGAQTIIQPPAITVQPTAQTACSTPGTASFGVTATGTGLTYQWRLNGSALSNAGKYSGVTTATLSLSGLVAGDTVAAGAGYDCVVSGTSPASPVTSDRVALTVSTVPSISVQPSAQTVCSSLGTASFSVTAAGTGLTYQWRLNGSPLSNGGKYSGVTTATLSLSSLVAGDTVAAGVGYDCVVSGTSPCSAATSTRVALTVNPSGAITVQPDATYAGCSGSSVNLTVTATGSPTYAWRKRGAGWGSGGAWSETTGSGGTLIGSSSLGSSWGMWNNTDTTEMKRNFGAMSVGDVFYVEMDNSAVDSGKSVGFSLRNSSDAQLLVFYFNGGDANYKIDRSGGVADTGVPYTTDGLEFTVTVTSSSTFSMSVKIKGGSTYGPLTGTFKNSGPVSRFQAWNFDAGGGNNLYFNNIKVGPGLTYPLYDDSATAYSVWSGNLGQGPLANGGDISGADTATLTIANLEAGDAGTYDVVVYNSCGGEVSSSANGVLSVVASPVGGTATAAAATICSGSTTTIGLTGSTGTIQWEQSADGSTGWANVTGGSGATTATYTTPALAATTYYRAKLTSGSCSAAYSSVASVTVNAATVGGTTSPGDATLCSGGTTTITLSGHTGSIQKWQSSPDNSTWSDIVSTANPYTTAALTANTYYRAEVKSGVCAAAFSASTLVTVNATTVGGTTTPGAATICSGSTTTITLSGHTGSIQKWQSSPDNSTWSDIVSTANPYTTAALTANTYYRAEVKSGVCAAAFSASTLVTVNPTSVGGTATATASTVVSGGSTTITLTGSTGSIQWYSSTDGSNYTILTGETASTLDTGALTATKWFRATVTSGVCGGANSTAAQVSVRPSDATWDGGSGANANTMTEANWVGDLYPVAGASSVMRFAGATRLSPSVTHAVDSAFGSIYFNSGASAFTLSGNAMTIHSLIQNDSANLQTVNNALALGAGVTANAASGNLALGGVISGANSLTKAGSGTLTLSGANTFSAGLIVQEGTVSAITSASALGADGVTLGHSSGSANATIQGAGLTLANAITVAAGSSGTATIRNDSGTTTLTGGMTLNKPVRLVSGATALILQTAGISGSSAVTVARDAGTGQVRFNVGNAAFTGEVTVESGVLQILSASALSSANAVTVASGATNDIRANVTYASIAGAGTLTKGNAGGITLTVGPSSGSTTFSGTMENGTGSLALTKTGSGTLTMSGANTYTGATAVSAGTLIVSGSSASSAHTVASGATLMGAGTVGDVTVNGIVDPGNAAAAAGSLKATSLTLGAGGRYTFDIANVAGTPGTEWDLVNVGTGAGTVTVSSSSGSPFVVYVKGNPTGFSSSTSYSWVIADAGTISGLDAGDLTVNTSLFTPSTDNGVFTVIEDASHNLVLTFTPVPASVAATDGAHLDKVTVTWSDLSYETGYKVYRNTANNHTGETQIGGTLAANTTSYDDTTAVSGTLYYYWVKAATFFGDTGYSASDSGYVKLATPTGVAATDGTIAGYIQVTWNDNVTGATSYHVYRHTSDDSGSATDLGEKTTPFNDSSVSVGVTYYYWVRAANSSSSSLSDFSASDSGYRPVLPPTTGASAITFSSVSGTGMTVSWTRGDGEYVMVVAKQGSAPTDPTDLTVYDADAAFGSGDETATGSFVVYKGSGTTGTTVQVTGLSPQTEYHFAVYEFNSATGPKYRTSDAPKASQYTLFSEPTDHATAVAFTSVDSGNMNVSWANGNGSGRLVIAKAGSAPFPGPVDATVYTANANFNSGSILSGGRVVYSGSGNSFTLTGLLPQTQYYLQVYEYNGSGLSANYFTDFTSSPSGNPGNRYTLSTEPSSHATPFTATAASSSSINLSWNAASGAFGYMILQRTGANPTGTPTDGQAYSVSDVIGDATVAAIVTPGTSTTISGLSAGTAYYFSVVPYNWNASAAQTYNYRTAATIPTANATTFAAEPNTQATSITVSGINEVTLTGINWVNGDGASRLVVVKAGGAVDSFPVDGTAYTANANFGSGTQIGTGNYVVHAGSGPIASLSNLGRDRIYHFRVFEFNGSGATANYLTSAATGNPVSQTTMAADPLVLASGLSVTPVNATTATLRWSMNAGMTNVLVAVRATSGTTMNTPSDKSTYTADAIFASGSNLGTLTYVVYKGAGTSVDITGLTPGTVYAFGVFTYNGSSAGAENYETTGARLNFTTLVAEPTQATGLLFSGVTKTGMTVSWTPGTGANRMVVVRALNAVNWAPTDATAYSTGISSDFSVATDVENGNKIVYSGSGTSVTLTGMTVGTLYYVKVYEFSGASATLNYNVDDATGNPANKATLNDEPPTVQASGFTVTAFSDTTLTLGWTPSSDGDRTLIAGRENDEADSPVNGTTYTADASWTGSGSAVLPNSKAVYANTGSSVVVTDLTPASQYYFGAFAYNVAGYKYLLTDAPTLSRWTLSTEPANHVTGLTASGPTSSSLELGWTGSAGSPAPDGYLLVRKQGSAPTFVPVDGQSYTAGPQGDSYVVVLSGVTTSLSVSGLAPSTRYYFALYPFCRLEGYGETFNYKTGGTVATADAQTSDALLIKDQFNYTAGDALNGKNGNDLFSSGWSGAWSVTLENQGSATATLNTGSLTAPSGYPTTVGNKVRAGQFSTDLGTERFKATRTFTDAFTESQGRIYAAVLVRYEWNNNGVFVGLSLMDGTDEKAFVGRPLQGAELLGADSYGAGQSMSTRSFYGGNTYLLIVRYNFSTRKLSGLIYNSAVASGVPAEEPGTWDIEVEVPEGRITQITGLRLAAGNKPGNVDFDEIRVGNTWSGLLGLSSGGASTPTVQASQFQFGYERKNQFNVAFSRGNGAAVLVLARKDSAVNASPVDGVSYTANANFGSGTQIGTGNYVVYNGSDPLPSFVLQNLLKETTYHFKAFEYNSEAGTKYLTTDGASGNPSSYTTLSPPTGVSAGMASTTGADLSWAQWNNRYVMVVYNVGSVVTFTPTDGVDYSTGSQTGGTILDAGTASKTTLSHTGVTPSGSTVYYKFFSRNNNYYSTPVEASVSLVASTLDLYDGFPRWGMENLNWNTGAGGTGWGGWWTIGGGQTDWWVQYADGGSLGGVTAAGATGNRAYFWGDANGRTINVTRAMSSSINNGTYYLSWRMKFQHGGYNNYAGLQIVNSSDTVEAFIGNPYSTDNLAISEYGGWNVSGQGIDAGSDYIFVVKLVLSSSGDDVISANCYKSGSRLIGEEPIVWDATATTSIDNVAKIRMACGGNTGNQIGITEFDEIRMARNWTEAIRYEGQVYRTMLETGPTPELVFIGTDYSTLNSPLKTQVTDADLADSGNKLDIAVRWTSPYGVFLTNTLTTLNDTNSNPAAILSTRGNVVPNWDPLMRSGGTDTSLGYDRTFAGYIGANGSTVVTSYYPTAFTGSEFGSWDIEDEFMITVSGQTYPSSGAKVPAPTAGAEQVPDRRAFTINMELPFTVVDDDPEPPIVQGFNIANYTDEQMLNTGLALSGQIMDDYSGVDPASITFGLSNTNPSPVLENQTFTTGPGNSADTKGVFATLSKTLDPVPYADNQVGTWSMVVHGTDIDNDRSNDSASTNRIFNFSVVDDDTNAPTTVLMNFPGALMNVPFIVVTNGTAPGDKIRNLYERRSGSVATNILTRVTDGDLAQSGTTKLQFVFGAQDVYSKPARGTTGDTNTVMSFNIGNVVVGQFANYNSTLSTALSTNALTNYWTFADGEWSSATINSMMAAGQMQVLARIPDLDNDRPGDRATLQTQVGSLQVLDDDIRGPAIRRMDVEGAYGEADTVFSSFELAEGWTTAFGGNSEQTIVDSMGRTWMTRGVLRTTLPPKFTSTYRMGLLVTTYSDPWIQLPPILNPGTFSVYAGHGTGADVDMTLQYKNGAAWTTVSSLTVTNQSTEDVPDWQVYQYNVDMLGIVTLRLTRAATGPQIYFDDIEVIPAPLWTNSTAFNANWSEVVDDYSQVDEFRVVSPSRSAVPPTLPTDGTSISAALTNAAINVPMNRNEQGVLNGYLVAIDNDNDRTGDRAMGTSRALKVRVDRTPPPLIPKVKAINDAVDDPSSQFDLSWNEDNVEMGSDDPNSANHPTWDAAATTNRNLLSPWRTYKVYYGPYDPNTEGGNIYGDFVSSGTYKNWNSVSSTNTIEDPGAGAFQPNYLALTNSARKSIRLYDLDYDKDYIVVVVGVDEAGNESTVDNTSWSTNNTIKFAVTQGLMKARTAVAAAFPTNNNLQPNDKGAAALYWLAAGQTNSQGTYTNVTKEYDLIYWDSPSFQESSNIIWQPVGTAKSNWFADARGQDNPPRGNMRFYRASYKDRWQRSRLVNGTNVTQRPLASEDVYAMHSVVLSEGYNYVALHGQPYTNTFAGVFGTDTSFWPASMTPALATRVQFFSPGVNAPVAETYFFGNNGGWYKEGGTGSNVADEPQDDDFFTRGFAIILPALGDYQTLTATDVANTNSTVPAMMWHPVAKVPTNGPVNGTSFSHVISCGEINYPSKTEVYNVVALNLPVAVHPSQMGLTNNPNTFRKGTRGFGDEIYTLNTSTKGVLSGSTIYCDTAGVWRFVNGNGAVPWGHFRPNDVIVIVSRNGGVGSSWTWTYSPTNFYRLPTRWMGQ